MLETAAILTDRFLQSPEEPVAIPSPCPGEQFIVWLRSTLEDALPAEAGFQLEEAREEDGAWGFYARHPKGDLWIEICSEGDPCRWVVSVDWQGRNLFDRWFFVPDRGTFRTIADLVWALLQQDPAINFQRPPWTAFDPTI